MMEVRRWGRRTAVGAVVAVVSILTAACSSSTAPANKPTEAWIRVSGTSPVPLQLVVSTNFSERIDEFTGEVVQVTNRADTTQITTLPFESTVALTDLGSVLVSLTNRADEPADVRLRVNLDAGQDPYDQRAIMSEGGQLRYVFVFLQTVF